MTTLSNHEDTAARVVAAIERLGFRRNLGALNLRRGSSTGTIGLVLEDVVLPARLIARGSGGS